MKNKALITLFLFLIFILFVFSVIRKYSPYYKGAMAASTCGVATMTDPRDGQVYPIVQIGTQCWMAKNLNYGTYMDGEGSSEINHQDPLNNVVKPFKYCLNDDINNCPIYGGFYQWHEAVGLDKYCDDNDCSAQITTYPWRGICPAGWHIPSDVEDIINPTVNNDWSALEDYLKISPLQGCSPTRNDAWACSDAGTKMKEGGISGLNMGIWGSIQEDSVGWNNFDVDGHFWSSGATSNPTATNRTWSRTLEDGNSSVLRKAKEKNRGFNVRCVKDPAPPTPTPTLTPTPTPTFTPTPTLTPTLIPTPTLVPCQVQTSPTTLNLSAGGTGTVTASVISGLGSASITRIRFGSYNTSIATVSPTSDVSSPYSTTVTGVSGGSTAVWGTADLSDGRMCPSSASSDTNVNVKYTISGNVFDDVDKDRQKDTLPLPGESNYIAVPGISISPVAGTINVFPNGAYTISNLPAGTYRVSYTSLPVGDGYFMIWPQFASFDEVKVGSLCDINLIIPLSPDASCTAAKNVINLNFAISNSMPWIQTYGLDIRVDNGFDNPQPESTTCGGGSFASGISGSFTSPGVVFTGDTTAEFGQGSSSSTGWVVGGGSYPEVFNNAASLKTSTQNLLDSAQRAGIIITPLESIPTCSNPSVSCNLDSLSKGFYHTGGDLKIDGNYTFSNENVVIVSDGKIIITGDATDVKTINNSMVIFSAKNIIIDSTIGVPADACLYSGQLQGVFSADNNITIEGIDDCTIGTDKMLNIDGTLIANATQGSGIFVNNRDLCGGNLTYPSVTIKARPDFILNTPGFLRESNIVSQEQTP